MELHVAHCIKLTCKSLSVVCHSLKYLTGVDASYIPGITSAMFQAAVEPAAEDEDGRSVQLLRLYSVFSLLKDYFV